MARALRIPVPRSPVPAGEKKQPTLTDLVSRVLLLLLLCIINPICPLQQTDHRHFHLILLAARKGPCLLIMR